MQPRSHPPPASAPPVAADRSTGQEAAIPDSRLQIRGKAGLPHVPSQ